MSRLQRMLNRPGGIGVWFLNRKICRLLPNTIYLYLKYRFILGRWPNFKNPRYLSEKIQWLKINERNELYPILVDKYAVRKYISEKIGDQYLVPLIGVWDSVEDIPWEKLPQKFVLKTTDGSHTNIICADKTKLDIEKSKKQLNRWIHNNQTYYYEREWPYKAAKSKIIAEEYIESSSEGGLVDYKFMCFNGKADNVMICSERQSGNTKFEHFDREWKFLRYQYVDENKPNDYTKEKPVHIEKMFDIAEKLAAPFAFVRVDLYCENGHIYFGELTFFPQSGFDTDYTIQTDLYLGSKLILPTDVRENDNICKKM